jgi:hypothetical protein
MRQTVEFANPELFMSYEELQAYNPESESWQSNLPVATPTMHSSRARSTTWKM